MKVNAMHRRLFPFAALVAIAVAAWFTWQRDLPQREALTLGVGLAATGLFLVAALWEPLFNHVDNRNSLLLVGLYVPWFVLTLPGYSGLIMAGAAFVLTMFSARTLGLGGGAAKLITVAALWVGGTHVYTFVAILFVGAMALGLMAMALRRRKSPMALVVGVAAAYVLLIKLQPFSGWQMPLG